MPVIFNNSKYNKLDYSIIDKLLYAKKSTKKDLYDFLEVSRQGFDSMIQNKTLRVDVLEKIADYFNVSPCYFFGYEEDKSVSLVNEPDIAYNNLPAKKDAHDIINIKLDKIWEEMRDFLRTNSNMATMILEIVNEQRKLKEAFEEYMDLRGKGLRENNDWQK